MKVLITLKTLLKYLQGNKYGTDSLALSVFLLTADLLQFLDNRHQDRKTLQIPPSVFPPLGVWLERGQAR